MSSLRRAKRFLRTWWRWYLALAEMGPDARFFRDFTRTHKYRPGFGRSPSLVEVVFSYFLIFCFMAIESGAILSSFIPSSCLRVWHAFAAAVPPVLYCVVLSHRVGWRYYMFFLVSVSIWPVAMVATPSLIRARDKRIVQEVMES